MQYEIVLDRKRKLKGFFLLQIYNPLTFYHQRVCFCLYIVPISFISWLLFFASFFDHRMHVEISVFILIESSSRALQRYHFFIHWRINLYAYTFRGYKYSFMSLSLKAGFFPDVYWTGGSKKLRNWVEIIFNVNWYS